MLDTTFDGAQDLARAWGDGLRPDPALTVSAWADRHRILSPRGANEAGPWRTARTPYLKEIMDCLSPSHPCQRVVVMKGAQVGFTECGNNWLGFIVHHAPGPALAVQPTVELAKRFSQQRVDPLIEDSPVLREKVAPARARDSGNTVLSKEFPGGILVLTGANSAVGLRSMPARYLFLDEVDAYPASADEEGDPVALAEARTRTFAWRRKVLLGSTPTIQGLSRIEREYEASDQRRFFVPCPHCGTMQWLRFERLRWDDGHPETAAYLCEACEQRIEERHKTSMLANGAWRPTATSVDPLTVGFHVSSLYSPIGWLSWERIARDWVAAQGSDEAKRSFKNSVLGETWVESGEAPDWQRLYERREETWRRGTVPAGGLFLTAGADVQKDRIEVSIWAWGRGLESWLVDHVVIEGGPGAAEAWAGLDALVGSTWPHASGVRLGLARLGIDTGYEAPAVYAWARRHGAGQVVPLKGVDGFNRAAPIVGPTYVDASEGGKRIRRGARLWTVAVATFKSETYRFLRLDRPTDEAIAAGAGFPAGYLHLPQGTDAEWTRQLVAEQLVTVKTRRGFSKLEWQKLRERNEALDCRVYARAAAWIAGADRWSEAKWAELEKQLGAGSSAEVVETASAAAELDAARRPPAALAAARPPRVPFELSRLNWNAFMLKAAPRSRRRQRPRHVVFTGPGTSIMPSKPEERLDRRDFMSASIATIGASAALVVNAGSANAQNSAASSVSPAPGAPSATVYTGDTIQGKKVVSALNVNDLEPGQKHLLYFQGVQMPTGQYWYVSVTVAKGAKPGKRVVLASGVHGDEMSSVHTVQTVMNQLDPAEMSGTVMAVTDVSRPAMEGMQRRWPNSGRGVDLIDMNREWPGNEDGATAPSRHAGLLFNRLLRPNADAAIDFHTGTTGFDVTAFNIAGMDVPEIRAMAELYPVGQIFDNHVYPGVLHNAFIDVGIPSFTPEIGAARILNLEMISLFVEGTMNVLKHHGILAGPMGRTGKDVGVFIGNSALPILATQGGLVEHLVKLNDKVEAGQKVAIQRNSFGEVVAEYTSSVAGEVTGQRSDAMSEPGNPLAFILFHKATPDGGETYPE